MAKVIFQVAVIAVAAVVIVLRALEVSESESGLWQEYPHSGFTPDCPTWDVSCGF